MDDLISRQVVLDDIQHNWHWETVDGIKPTTVLKQVMTDIKNLPSAEKTGHWAHDGSHWKNRFICSECDYKLFDEPTNYCPNCGARMAEGSGE